VECHDAVSKRLEAQAAEAIEQVRKDRQLPAAADFLQGRLLVHERRWAAARQGMAEGRRAVGLPPLR